MGQSVRAPQRPLQVTNKPQIPQQTTQFNPGAYADQGQPQLPPQMPQQGIGGFVNQAAQGLNLPGMMQGQQPQQPMPQQSPMMRGAVNPMPQGGFNPAMLAQLLRR
jgi:hypothetical protein